MLLLTHCSLLFPVPMIVLYLQSAVTLAAHSKILSKFFQYSFTNPKCDLHQINTVSQCHLSYPMVFCYNCNSVTNDVNEVPHIVGLRSEGELLPPANALKVTIGRRSNQTHFSVDDCWKFPAKEIPPFALIFMACTFAVGDRFDIR